MAAETRIYKIEEGSLIVFPFEVSPDDLDIVVAELIDKCGHDRFVLMVEPVAGATEVYGPADIIEGLEARGIVK